VRPGDRSAAAGGAGAANRHAWYAGPVYWNACTSETAAIAPSPWQTSHASPPVAVVLVSACAAAASESWQARQAS